MNDFISVAVLSSEKPSVLYGPVKAIVTVKNLSFVPIQILLPYPNPNNLSFECKATGFVKQKEVEREKIERTVPISIDAQEGYTSVYYLNRYLNFLKAGEATISYRLGMLVTSGAGTEKTEHKDTSIEGEFRIKLVQGSEKDLREEMATYAAKLESNNRQEKMQAAEALAFLDTPLCIDYVARMLSIENLEIIGIKALGRFPSPRTNELIIQMLSHKESAVVGAALNEINQRKIPVPRRKVQSLLSSDNANIRWITLDWLATRPDSTDLEFVLPLLKDENAAVREKASAYAEVLKKH